MTAETGLAPESTTAPAASSAITPSNGAPEFDIDRVRRDFPILQREVHGKPLVYLDTAASAQRPQAVIDAVSNFYREHNANVHRGVHLLSQEATDAYEDARRVLARWIHAESEREIVFTRGTTESVNLVAQSFVRPRVGPGDQIVITHMEHHSNIVPWQMVCEQTGAELVVAPIDERGELILDRLEALLGPQVKILALVHTSNALGTVNPVQEICAMANRHGIPVLVDGAQAMPHGRVNVQELDCDFLCLSGHKMYGPTGIGALWARQQWLEDMPPYQGGGEMIRTVTFDKTEYNDVPAKFEAGTPNIAGGVGLGAAVRYLDSLGMEAIAAHEHEVLEYGTERLLAVEGLRIIGTARNKAGVLSFTIEGVHPHDLGTLIDHYGVALRTGHHCAMPVMQFFGVPATARASLGLYNTKHEIDILADALERTVQMLR
ncbi:aminotransferase class V-fold PLP-dependent enzyme [Elongatibacter sediminis]|uniref:Cysteine desulfurase n=1 Tax=Elongatibacter sediminis TaxID=3119006 RepID=A0AAW9RLH8_9GAMM